jgi:hypothetical protein
MIGHDVGGYPVLRQHLGYGIVPRLQAGPGSMKEVGPGGVQIPPGRHTGHGTDVAILKSHGPLCQPCKIRSHTVLTAVRRKVIPVKRVKHDNTCFHRGSCFGAIYLIVCPVSVRGRSSCVGRKDGRAWVQWRRGVRLFLSYARGDGRRGFPESPYGRKGRQGCVIRRGRCVNHTSGFRDRCPLFLSLCLHRLRLPRISSVSCAAPVPGVTNRRRIEYSCPPANRQGVRFAGWRVSDPERCREW